MTKTTRRTGIYLIVVAAIFVGLTTISYDKSTRRQLYEIIYTSELNIDEPTFIDEDGVCVNAFLMESYMIYDHRKSKHMK